MNFFLNPSFIMDLNEEVHKPFVYAAFVNFPVSACPLSVMDPSLRMLRNYGTDEQKIGICTSVLHRISSWEAEKDTVDFSEIGFSFGPNSLYSAPHSSLRERFFYIIQNGTQAQKQELCRSLSQIIQIHGILKLIWNFDAVSFHLECARYVVEHGAEIEREGICATLLEHCRESSWGDRYSEALGSNIRAYFLKHILSHGLESHKRPALQYLTNLLKKYSPQQKINQNISFIQNWYESCIPFLKQKGTRAQKILADKLLGAFKEKFPSQ